ncbi:MAG TPA: hypothetical protein VGO91_20240 [Pyrinomonadaceae bacterium]|nr:hypothetical protein [Pyrinomonadaceae bacterium]
MREELFKTHSSSLILPPSYFILAFVCLSFVSKVCLRGIVV